MKFYFVLAWRNLWRNKRRTFITVASIFFAVILAISMRSLQLGMYDNMIENAVELYSGYIQVHKKGYWENKSLNNSFIPSDSLYRKIEQHEQVKSWVPRLSSFALASHKQYTKGGLVVGIDPQKEQQLTGLKEKVVQGKYFKEKEQKLLLAERLAERLGVKVQDTVVLLGQGYHGVSAAGKYPVKGIISFGSPELNKSMMYLPLKEAQSMYGARQRLTTIALDIKDPDAVTALSKQIHNSINTNRYEVMSWKAMMPALVQAIEVDSAGGMIVIAVLYVVIAFGIFGTLLMMMNERQREFGIMVANGMRKTKLSIVLVIETLFIAVLGVLGGILVSTPLIAYLYYHPVYLTGELAEAYRAFGLEPVYAFSLDPDIFVLQGGAILIIAACLSIYPLQKILRLNTLQALQQ